MQRLQWQKGQMVWCEDGMQAGHAPTVNRDRGMVDSSVSTKSDMTIGFEIQLKVSVFGKGHMCWPRDVDSGKVGTGTSFKRVGCGQHHVKSPLHTLVVGCGPQH
jgi:hypothetical protein